MPLSNAQARDVESVLHPYTNLLKLRETGPLVIERGEGVRVYDDRGKDYIEGLAGLWCTALGRSTCWKSASPRLASPFGVDYRSSAAGRQSSVGQLRTIVGKCRTAARGLWSLGGSKTPAQ